MNAEYSRYRLYINYKTKADLTKVERVVSALKSKGYECQEHNEDTDSTGYLALCAPCDDTIIVNMRKDYREAKKLAGLQK